MGRQLRGEESIDIIWIESEHHHQYSALVCPLEWATFKDDDGPQYDCLWDDLPGERADFINRYRHLESKGHYET